MDDRNIEVPGARDVDAVLATDPIYIFLGRTFANPVILGAVLAGLVVAMILLGPSTDSHFIYTDF